MDGWNRFRRSPRSVAASRISPLPATLSPPPEWSGPTASPVRPKQWHSAWPAESGSSTACSSTPEPHVVERSDFASAQAACRSAKHRILTVESIAEDLNWPEILRTAVSEGAVGFDTPPVPQFAANVGILGLRKWSELLMASKGPKRWTAVFGADRRAAIGLTRLYDCLNHAYTTPAASRPLHATFLREAAAITGESRWVSAADLFDQSATRWQSISDRIVAIDPAIARYGACSDERAVGILSRPEPDLMATLYGEQDEIVADASLDAATAADAYRDIGLLVTEIADLEAEALTILR